MFGRLVMTLVTSNAILPSDALWDPRRGVARKQTPKVDGVMSLSRVPWVAEDLFRAALTTIPPRLCTTKSMGAL